MFLTDKLDSSIIKLLRSDNFEFIISFFYALFRGENSDDSIPQVTFEKELEIFIKKFNQTTSFRDKNQENAKTYTESWIKSGFLTRRENGDFENEYLLELADSSVQVMNFVDTIGLTETGLHAAVQSEFENALSNLKIIAYSSKSLKEHNLKEIDKEIAKLQKRKKLIEAWDLKSFEDEVIDKYTAAKETLKKLPSSFKKVELVFGKIADSLEKKVNEANLHKWNILSFTLDEIEEKINNSPQGKSFEGFEKFYASRPKELLKALEEVFASFEAISTQEQQQSIRSLLGGDILRAKKKAYQKKSKIVTKLKDAFKDSAKQERKLGISLLKEIKKIYQDRTLKIDYKAESGEIDGGFGIDLFMQKNYFEPRAQSLITKVDLSQKAVKEVVDTKEIFRYSSISQIEITKRVGEFLKHRERVELSEVLEKYPIAYGVDEFMQYLKHALSHQGQVDDLEECEFDFAWIRYRLKVQSGKVEFRKVF